MLLPGPGGPTWLQHATGAALAHPGSVASHSTSARLDGVDGYGGFVSIDLTVVRPNTLRSPGVTTHRVHTLDRCDVLMIGPVPCTNRARTLCDLAGVVTADMLERALDDAVRRGSNPRWIRATAERLRERGRTGPVQLVRALDAMEQRGRVRDSWFEKLVEQCLDDPVIGAVSRQYQLNDGDGRHVARFDLAVPEVKLGIEAHSRRHHFTKEEEASDEHRDHAASVLGWDVMYLGYSAVSRRRRWRRQFGRGWKPGAAPGRATAEFWARSRVVSVPLARPEACWKVRRGYCPSSSRRRRVFGATQR
ncbi:MAG: hypothetical protein V9G12_14890 [Microthrixaceae bacterium]